MRWDVDSDLRNHACPLWLHKKYISKTACFSEQFVKDGRTGDKLKCVIFPESIFSVWWTEFLFCGPWKKISINLSSISQYTFYKFNVDVWDWTVHIGFFSVCVP